MAVSVIAYKCDGLVCMGEDSDLIHFNPIYTDFFTHFLALWRVGGD